MEKFPWEVTERRWSTREWEAGREAPFNWPFIHQFPCPSFSKSLLLSHLCLKPCLGYLSDSWWKKRCVNWNESGYECMNLALTDMTLKFSLALCYPLYHLYCILAQERCPSHRKLNVDKVKEDSKIIFLNMAPSQAWWYLTVLFYTGRLRKEGSRQDGAL